MRSLEAALAIALAAAAVPIAAQMAVPGAPDITRVKAGTYTVDPDHTQVAWTVNHLGFSLYHGLFGDASGTLTIDPAHPAAAKLSVTFPIGGVLTTSKALDAHLLQPDFFDAARYPTAAFTATRIVVSGTRATITGMLTLHGITKPLTLDARFTGAGPMPMVTVPTRVIGFAGAGSLNRSDYGLGYGVPAVGDKVDLVIAAAFQSAG